MERRNRILLYLGCGVLLLISWGAAVTAKSDAAVQAQLIEQAQEHVLDEEYICAVPILEQAASYNDKHTWQAEELLKDVYLKLSGQSGYVRKYEELLTSQLARKKAGSELFEEAARYYLANHKEDEAFAVLKDGIARTDDENLKRLYEDTRYQYSPGRYTYQQVTIGCNGAIQVMQDGFWGLATADGAPVLPCEYDAVSTLDSGRIVVKAGNVISAVDTSNNRVQLLHGEFTDFTNCLSSRIGLKTQEGWLLADGEFNLSSQYFEALGAYACGVAAAQSEGKWGVVDGSGKEWIIPACYDTVIQDELGRCCGQEAIFVKQGDEVLLFLDGEQTQGVYEDARPFADGWAAVKMDGKWGFIDTQGNVTIPCQFDDALSFGQHLAAVKQGDLWGYISMEGRLVIDTVFLEAKSFHNGSAPVKTGDGWQFITLLEYM